MICEFERRNSHNLVAAKQLKRRFGFAARVGFAVVALRRRQRPDQFGLCPWFGLWPYRNYRSKKSARVRC